MQLTVIVLAAIGATWLLQSHAPVGQDVEANSIAREVITDKGAPSQEVTNATLTLVVFSDYQCPICKLTEPAMDAAVLKDGHVRVVYKDWPIFGARSQRAAEVALAIAKQGRYAVLHRKLMAEGRKLDDAVLQADVQSSGGNWGQLQIDLKRYSAEINQELVRTRRQAFGLGLAGTPAYLVGDFLIVGGTDEDGFGRAIAAARDKPG